MSLHRMIEEVITVEHYLVIENGVVTSKNLPSGVTVTNEIKDSYAFQALHFEGKTENDTLPNDVIQIKNSKDTNVDLQVIYVYQNDGTTNSHVVFVAESFSKFNVIESVVSIDLESHTVLRTIEYIVNDEGQMSITGLNEACSGVSETLTTASYVGRNGQLAIYSALLNDGNTDWNNRIYLAKENAYAVNKNVVVSRSSQKKNVKTHIGHHAMYTKGEILSHGVAKDQSVTHFDGISFIPNGMAKSDASQELRLMMLDTKARATANPILLIDEFDVLASHAAGVGQVDEEALYYLQSRGLTKADAEKLIIKGFLMPVVEHIENEKYIQRFVEIIEKKTK